MLRGFACADVDHRNVQAVTPFENVIILDIYFTQICTELVQERLDRFLSLFTQVAARPAIESHLARARRGQARVFRMLRHGFGLEYFWNGPEYG